MKKTVKYSIMAAFAVTLGIAASVTQAQTSADRVYAIDGRNEVVTSGANLCWRTGFWTPAAAATGHRADCRDVAPPRNG